MTISLQPIMLLIKNFQEEGRKKKKLKTKSFESSEFRPLDKISVRMSWDHGEVTVAALLSMQWQQQQEKHVYLLSQISMLVRKACVRQQARFCRSCINHASPELTYLGCDVLSAAARDPFTLCRSEAGASQ